MERPVLAARAERLEDGQAALREHALDERHADGVEVDDCEHGSGRAAHHVGTGSQAPPFTDSLTAASVRITASPSAADARIPAVPRAPSATASSWRASELTNGLSSDGVRARRTNARTTHSVQPPVEAAAVGVARLDRLPVRPVDGALERRPHTPQVELDPAGLAAQLQRPRPQDLGAREPPGEIDEVAAGVEQSIRRLGAGASCHAGRRTGAPAPATCSPCSRR